MGAKEIILEGDKKYLFLPYENHAKEQKLQISMEGEATYDFMYPLATQRIDGWVRLNIPKNVRVYLKSDKPELIQATYIDNTIRLGELEEELRPRIHFSPRSGKIKEVICLSKKENVWHMVCEEDFSMGKTVNKGVLKSYKSNHLILWEENETYHDAEISPNLKIISDKSPWIGDVESHYLFGDVTGNILGIAKSKYFESENVPVNNVLSLPVTYKEGKINPISDIDNLRVWKRSWYIEKIIKEFFFTCRFRIAPGEWPGVSIKEKDNTMNDIRADVCEIELELLIGMEPEILIDIAGLQWRWEALTGLITCKEYSIPVEERNGKIKLHFYCDRMIQELFTDDGRGMMITYPELVKKKTYVIHNKEIENIKNPTFRLQYYPELYIKIDTKGDTAAIIEMQIYSLRSPNYSSKNLQLLKNMRTGEALYKGSSYTVFQNSIEDRIYGEPNAWVLNNGRTVLSPIRVVEDFQWANTPWGDMTRVIDRGERWDFKEYDNFPELITNVPVLNAAYNLAVDVLQKNISEEYAMPGNKGLINAGLLQGKGEGFGVWVRDTCHNAFRIMNFLAPCDIRKSLLYITKNGFDNGSDAAAMPAIAIWDYYLSTKDKSILYEVFPELLKYVEKADLSYDESKGLMHAESSAAQDAFPEKENGGYSLSPQIYYAYMYLSMACICKKIGLHEEKGVEWKKRGEKLIINVKELYWSDASRCYTSGPKGSESYCNGWWEATGAELSVWPRFNIASTEQRQMFLDSIQKNKRALSDFGLNWYPFAEGKNHFWDTCWVSWSEGIAAAANSVSDVELLRTLIYQQVRNVIINKTFHEAINNTSGKAWRWPGLTWHASGFLGFFVYGILGITYDEDKVVISPLIPAEFEGMQLKNLKYRNSVLDIEIHGMGHDFEMYIDGVKAEYISGDIMGYHHIDFYSKEVRGN